MRVTYWGGAGTVTGSKYLLEVGNQRLLVDCGMFQGLKVLRERNWKPLAFDPANVNAVLLTHAHVDHSGALPLLVRQGFRGPIYCTTSTAELAAILLRDAAWLQEEDAARANRKGYSKHRPAVPLYTLEHAEAAIERFVPIDAHTPLPLGNVEASFHPAGHILGACGVRVEYADRAVWFSGDVGRPNDILMYAPEPPRGADWVVMETTYGDREHDPIDPVDAVAEVARKVLLRGGVLLVPSFAVGRAQVLLLALQRGMADGRIPPVPVYVNSPMTGDVTALYHRFAQEHRLTTEQTRETMSIARFVHTVEESKALNNRPGPMVIISASGMLTGGRVLHHLVAFAGNPANGIMLPGFQSPGTRGAALAAGARTVKVHGAPVDVNAEVFSLDALSAHADRTELGQWLAKAQPRPSKVTLVHGEPAAAEGFRIWLKEKYGMPAHVADAGETQDFIGG